MTANVGSIDRLLRIVAGLAFQSRLHRSTDHVGAGRPRAARNGLFRFCPAYTLLGISTCGARNG